MSSLSRAFAKVGGNTLLSRLLGFARDLVIARVFGATAATDAFFIAFRIPNLLRRLFAEGAFALVLVPWLEGERRAQGAARLRDLFDRLSGTLAVLLALLTLLGVLGAPLLVLAFAPGFAHQPDQHALTT
ncbi:MAG: murein biosynthesis integral membrane protein MurJ, partial [Chromatiaceae bacterium]|nr:murein biosynthesis integral membrane protein MurJ [Chromatiaceae bacterium]